MQQLDQRAVRDVGADLGGRLPVAQPAVPPQRGVGAVRPALLLAQDEEQPRIRSAAEHLRGDAPGVIDRVGRQDRRVAGHDVGLRRARPVHQQDVGRETRDGSGQGGDGRRSSPPVRERLVDQVPYLRVRHIPGDHEERTAWPQALASEVRDVFGRDGAVAVACGTAPIRVAAVDLALEEPLRHRAGLRQLQRERRERARAGQLELARREGRVQGHVPQQVEHELELVTQGVGRYREEVLRRARRQVPPHTLDGRGDLLFGARRGALGEELGGELGQSLLAGRVADGARPEREADGHDGLLVVLDHDEREPVGKHRLLERREPNGREPRGLGRRGGKRLGGQAERRTGGQTGPSQDETGHAPHCATPLVAGFTMITSAFAGSRYLPATRRMSSVVTARKRSRSLLISAGDAWNMS